MSKLIRGRGTWEIRSLLGLEVASLPAGRLQGDSTVLHSDSRTVLAERVHKRTRDDHASEVAEDYVEAIADAIAATGVCRSLDLVKQFAVTHATVNNTIARLQRDGLVTTKPYQPIELTAAGKRLATTSRKRHEVVRSFLEALGVSSQAAEIDSEGIEHHVSKETLQAMTQVLEHGWPKK